MNNDMSKKTYDTFGGLSLYLKHDNGKSSGLNFGLVDKRPRITLFIKDKDTGIDVINIKFTYLALCAFIGLVNQLANSKDLEENFVFTSFDSVWENGKNTGEIAPIGSIKIHRNSKHAVQLTLSKGDGGEYSFPFALDGIYHKVKKGDIPITSSKGLSDLITKEFMLMMSNLYSINSYDSRYTVTK